jgi:hypothetical protein
MYPCFQSCLRSHAKETTSFFRSRSLDIEEIVPWLHEHGGYCDCEALGNIVDEFEKIISQEKKST